jgi:phage terminase large subunit-like protein
MEPDNEKRAEFLGKLEGAFPDRYAEILRYIGQDYRVMIRDDQLWDDFDSPDWNGAIWCCGRAYGKTWAGAPAAIEFAMQHPDCRIGLLAPTFGMGRTNMVEGASGIMQLSPRGFKPKYNKSEGSLTWPNGATAKLFSSENGDRVRGENFHYVWADEFCFFKFTGGDDDIWKMTKMALRAGKHPKYTITTSPKPIRTLKELHTQSKKDGSKIRFHTGTTFDNYALPQSFIDDVKLGEGTTLYNQEVLGMILDENLGAIFSLEDIKRVELDTFDQDPDEYNLRMRKLIDSMDQIVISVDPNVVEDINSDETGICVAGRRGDKGFVFKDASRRGKISEIYEKIVKLYHQYRAECLVVETNNGGDFIPAAIFNIDPMVVVKKVWASRGKKARAEPIGLLYERGRIYHVGIHRDLEAQMCEYNPQVHKKSPDRMDALVWAITYLFPSSSRGLFDETGVPEAFTSPTSEKKAVLTDLYADLVEDAEGAYNMYSIDVEIEDEFDIYI